MNILALFSQTANDMYALDTSNAVGAAILGGMILLIPLLLISIYVIASYLLSRIFKKAGVAMWKAWIPVYNTWVTLELGDQKGWWSLVGLSSLLTWIPSLDGAETASTILYLITFLASIAGSVFLYIAMYRIGLKLGKEGYFVLWAIFLPVVWYVWLAFDTSTWNDNAASATPVLPAKKEEE